MTHPNRVCTGRVRSQMEAGDENVPVAVGESLVLVAAGFFATMAWGGAETTYDFVACGHQKFTLLEVGADITAVGLEQWAIGAGSTAKGRSRTREGGLFFLLSYPPFLARLFTFRRGG